MYRRMLVVAVAVLGTLALVASPSFGVVTFIEGTELNGSGPTIWDPVTESIDSLSCPLLAADNYVPVEDGEFSGENDAFDGGLMLKINSTFFDDLDGNGNEVGESLTVGP